MTTPDIAPIYEELRRLAASALSGSRTSDSLQPTALVHEAYIKLAHGGEYRDRAHFMAVAATAMRQVLIDRARRNQAQKRDRREATVSTDLLDTGAETALDVLALDEALERLAGVDVRKARVVELRVFGGLTIEETAEQLGVSGVTVSTDWRFARAWLTRELGLTSPG